MRRFLYLLLFILAFWVSYKHLRPVVHAQTTCATDQTIGWHDCGAASQLGQHVDLGGGNFVVQCVTANYACFDWNSDQAFTTASSVFAYSGGVFDTIGNRLIIWGGGHNDYTQNEVYAITIPPNGSTPTASMIRDHGTTPSLGNGCIDKWSCEGWLNGNMPIAGMTPNIRHTYDMIEFMPNVNAMFVWGGGGLQSACCNDNSMWLLHLNTGTWEYLNPQLSCLVQCSAATATGDVPFVPSQIQGGYPSGLQAATAYDSNTGTIWLSEQFTSLWNVNVINHTIQNTWHYYGGLNGSCGGNYTQMAADTSRKRLWFTACGGTNWVDISSPAASAAGYHFVNNAGLQRGDANCGWVYDSNSTHLVGWCGGTSIFDYNPDTNTVTTPSYSGGNPGDQQLQTGTQGRFAYDPNIDAYVLNNGGSRHTWVLRTRSSTPDTTNPSNPSSLTATAISSSQINLGWTASTDDRAVGGYFVERCSGGGCSNFAQVGQVATNAFSDSGLTASTSYSYRVRAFDTSNNLSGYSNTATATTQAPDVTPPTAPSSLTATAVSSSQINLSWTASTDAVGVTRYRVERCSGGGCSSFVEITQINGAPPVTTYQDFGLTGSTSYSYRVRANDIAGNLSSYSNTATDTTQAAPPTTTLVDFSGTTSPLGVHMSDATFGLANWTTILMDDYTTGITRGGVSGATNYYTATGLYNFQGVQTLTTPRTFVPGETISVIWYNNASSSRTFTPVVSFTGASRSFLGGTWYPMSTLTLAAGATGTSTYVVDGTSTGTYSLVNTSAQIDQQQELIADKIILQSAGSNDVTAPTNPSSLTATSISQSQINLAWTASTDAVGVTSYLVERCSGAACGGFAQITTVNGAPPVTILSDTGLATNTSYSYRVRASDAAANLSGYSNTATATTMTNSDATPPTAPSSLVAQCISYRQCNLSWTGSTDNVGVTDYNVEQCAGVGCVNFTQAGGVSGTPPITAFSNYILATGVTYSWRIRANDAAGNFSGYSNVVSATTSNPGPLQVGSDKAYQTLAAAVTASQLGDTIEIDFNVSGANVTQDINKCITIRGVGPPGTQAQFIWDGGTYQSGTGSNPIPNDQGIFRVFPNCVPPGKVVLDNLKFTGAYGTSRNIAGVRVNPGFSIDILNCDFENNENGVLTGNVPTLADGSPSIIKIDHTTFARNGNDSGAHNVYVGVMGHLIFTSNKSVDSHVGHLLKSRAYESDIIANYFSTKDPTFDGSLEIDLPAGGTNYVIGNVIEQGTNTSNGAILKQGEEPPLKLGSTNVWNPTNQLYFINNTVFNYRTTGTFLDVTSTGNDFNNTPPPTLTFVSRNNILTNGGTLYPTSAPTLASNNNTTATSADFVSSATGNYNLVTGVSEINAAVDPGTANGVNLYPSMMYVVPGPNSITRPVVGALDIGAYEYGTQVNNNPVGVGKGRMRR